MHIEESVVSHLEKSLYIKNDGDGNGTDAAERLSSSESSRIDDADFHWAAIGLMLRIGLFFLLFLPIVDNTPHQALSTCQSLPLPPLCWMLF